MKILPLSKLTYSGYFKSPIIANENIRINHAHFVSIKDRAVIVKHFNLTIFSTEFVDIDYSGNELGGAISYVPNGNSNDVICLEISGVCFSNCQSKGEGHVAFIGNKGYQTSAPNKISDISIANCGQSIDIQFDRVIVIYLVSFRLIRMNLTKCSWNRAEKTNEVFRIGAFGEYESTAKYCSITETEVFGSIINVGLGDNTVKDNSHLSMSYFNLINNKNATNVIYVTYGKITLSFSIFRNSPKLVKDNGGGLKVIDCGFDSVTFSNVPDPKTLTAGFKDNRVYVSVPKECVTPEIHSGQKTKKKLVLMLLLGH